MFSEKTDVPPPWICSFSTAVTLKIRLRSSKSNQPFVKSQLYIHKNLLRIQPLVPKILCRQKKCDAVPVVMPTLIGSAPKSIAGLGGSVGCAVWLATRRLQVQPPPRSATFFRWDWSWNIFYGHSLPSADSRRAVVNFWRKNVHNTG